MTIVRSQLTIETSFTPRDIPEHDRHSSESSQQLVSHVSGPHSHNRSLAKEAYTSSLLSHITALVLHFSVGYLTGDGEGLEVMVEELECGSLLRDGVPALQHEAVDVVGQAVAHGLGHAVAALHLVDDVLAVQPGVRDLAVGEQLHEEDAVRPHVALDGEAAVDDGLGRGPLDGEARALLGAVLVVLDDSREAEVANFSYIVFTYQHVPSG